MIKPELQRIETVLSHLCPDRAHRPCHDPDPPQWQSTLPNLPGRSWGMGQPSTFAVTHASLVSSLDPVAAMTSFSGSKSLALPDFIPSQTDLGIPSLAQQLLQQLESAIAQETATLNQAVQQIQSLYQEGPIVDGWLEAANCEVHPQLTKLHHLDGESLVSYIEQLCDQLPRSPQQLASHPPYRLCGLDAEGRLWSRPCPPNQVDRICLAIARYHRLRQLLDHKQVAETRLINLTKTLAILQRSVNQAETL